ncbi:MAG: hypothetical protein QOE92_415 [Chloroflexota bacterium]|nr:hypothetical protein [Chloroflexota bacterium]
MTATVGALLLVAVAYESFTVGQALANVTHGTDVLRQAATVLGTRPENWTAENVATARDLQVQAAAEVSRGAGQMRESRLMAALSAVGYSRDQSQVLQDLADATVSGTDSFGKLVEVAGTVAEARDSGAPPGTRLLNLLAATSRPWQDASDRLEPTLRTLRADLRRPVLGPLAQKLRDAIRLLDEMAGEARIGVVASKFAPSAIGAARPQTYLVLLPNPSELRPAGGFSGVIGTVVMSGGAPTTVEVRNQDTFNPNIKKPVPVPATLGRYLKMFKNQLEIGDVGWDPDFPTTARTAEQMYQSATNRAVDGTISIDPYAIGAMLAVTGPVDAQPYGIFGPDNFFEKLNIIVNASTGPNTGKGALAPVSEAILKRVLESPASDWPRLFAIFRDQAEQRHLVGYFHDAAIAQAAHEVQYDGALVDTTHDYLLVADGNVGISKGDYFVKKSLDMKVEAPVTGVTRNQVTMKYAMPQALNDIDRALNPGEGSYRDYVRFYLPQGAQIADFEVLTDGKPSEGGLNELALDHDRLVAGTYFRLPRGHEATITLTYQVPFNPDAGYDLLVQKQLGNPGMPTTVQVAYPGGQVKQQANLAQDLRMAVRW